MSNANIPARFLVADIGGTNARFAYAERSADGDVDISHLLLLETDGFPSFAAALKEFLAETGELEIQAAAVCGAGPVVRNADGASIDLTNCDWRLTEKDLAAETGVDAVAVVNDFAAIACSLPLLKEDELRQIGGGTVDPGGPRGVLGAGTGLGVAGLVPDGDGEFALVDGEGGHADLAPATPKEMAIYEVLMRKHGSVTAETLLSGSGLEAIHDALCELEGAAGETVHAAEIATRAATGGEPICKESVEHFTRWLGAASANLALTLGTSGGIYIAGGIVPRWGGLFDGQIFRERFEDRPKMKSYLEKIPTFVVNTPDPALKGLAIVAADLLNGR